MTPSSSAHVRLHPDFSVAQAAVDRRTVVMLYSQTPAEPLEPAFDGPLPWLADPGADAH
jgi:hypothetical protein